MIVLDPRKGVVIYPMRVSIDDDLLYSRPFSEARGRWGLHEWKKRRIAAELARDYYALDQLERDYEMIGLP